MSNLNIPSDIIIDILSRQPVKSLLRFRCLSKTFCSLIDSPDFVKLHLSRSNGRKLILTGTPDDNIFSIDLNPTDNPVYLENPFKGFGTETETDILGSCNGLIALQSKKDYVLWNPSTKKYHILPRCFIDHENYGRSSLSGFGYDVASDDYKLVKFVTTCRRNILIVVFLYSLKTNTWKSIHDIPFVFLHHGGSGALIGSTLNWMATEYREFNMLVGYKKSILAFDLTTEKFLSVPQPDDILLNLNGVYWKDVGVLEGCLTMTIGLNDRFDIWLMKEYRVKESWTKLFSYMPSDITCIKSSIDYTRTLAYAKNEKEVLLMLGDVFTNCYSFIWHNLEDQKSAAKCFRIHIEPPSRPRIVECSEGYAGPLKEIMCLDSLVLPATQGEIMQ